MPMTPLIMMEEISLSPQRKRYAHAQQQCCRSLLPATLSRGFVLTYRTDSRLHGTRTNAGLCANRLLTLQVKMTKPRQAPKKRRPHAAAMGYASSGLVRSDASAQSKCACVCPLPCWAVTDISHCSPYIIAIQKQTKAKASAKKAAKVCAAFFKNQCSFGLVLPLPCSHLLTL